MSSDVYLDLSQSRENLINWDDPDKIETIRIGHLGQMSYFGYNWIEALRYFRDAQPTISADLPDQLNRMAEAFKKHCEYLQDQGSDYCRVRYGYEIPNPWDDVPEPGDFDELNQFKGWFWDYRID